MKLKFDDVFEIVIGSARQLGAVWYLAGDIR